MVVVFKATCLLLMVAIGLLFKQLFGDWKKVRDTDGYISNTTPMDRLKYNSIFFFISACLSMVFIYFGYLLICKITIAPPF